MTMSSDSDGYEQSDASSRPRMKPHRYERAKHPRSSPATTVNNQLNDLTSSLKKTTRNLNTVDSLLDCYRVGSQGQNAAIERLRDNLARSTESLRRERLKPTSFSRYGGSSRSSQPMTARDLEISDRRKYAPTSPHTDYSVDVGTKVQHKGTHKRQPSVRFDEDLDEIHAIHQTVRDLSSDQIRLEDDLDREIQQRTQVERDNKRMLQELSESLAKSQTKEDDEKSSERVDKRLHAIQEELRQQRLKQERKETNRNPNGVLSNQLQQAMAAHSQQEDKEMRERLVKAEADKRQLALRLETTQRNLDRSEGVKAAMQQQVDDYKSRLRLTEQDRSALHDRLVDMQEALHKEGLPLDKDERKQQRLQETTDRQERERLKYQQQVDALKSQVLQTQSLRDLEKCRSELQQSQQQHERLSQHLQSTNTELENKEKHVAQLVTQLEDTRDRLMRGQEEGKRAVVRQEEFETRLRSANKKAEAGGEKVQELTERLEICQQKRQQVKAKARDTIRQWKLKCSKLERDVVDLQQRLSGQIQHNEQLHRDSHSQVTQSGASTHRMDNLHREMNDILEKRAVQDEKLRIQDVEINELKSVRKDLELELRDTRNFMDKLDSELSSHHLRHNMLADEKLKLEEDFKTSQAKQQMTEHHLQKLQAEWNKLNLEHTEQTAQLADDSGSRRIAEANMRQLIQDVEIARKENDRLVHLLKEEKDSHSLYAADLHKEIDNKKGRRERVVVDLTNRLKRERAEMEAELQTLRLELDDSRFQLKTLRQQVEVSREESRKIAAEMARIEQENVKIKRRYERARAGYEEQARLLDAGDSRASELEHNLNRVSAHLIERDLEVQGVLRLINQEVNGLVEAVSTKDSDSNDVPSTVLLSSVTEEINQTAQHWLADIKSKLRWLRRELINNRTHHNRLKDNLEHSRADVEEIIQMADREKNLLHSQLAVEQETVQELKRDRQDLLIGQSEGVEAVTSLEKQVAQLEHHIGKNSKILPKSIQFPQQRPSRSQETSPQSDSTRLEDLQEERVRINDRYNRYKGTMSLLQQQLRETRLQSASHQLQSSGRSPGTSPINPANTNGYKPHRVSFTKSPVLAS